MKKKEKLSKKQDNLPRCSKEILKLMSVNPSIKYVVEKTGRHKSNVGKDIIKLIDKGYLKRIDRGLYKVIQKKDGTKPSYPKTDHFRLHNIQIQLRLNRDHLVKFKNIIYKDKSNFKVHARGNNNGDYFELGYTGLITKDNIFIFFPEDFDVSNKSIPGVYAKFDNIINKILIKWENIFKLTLYKEGRVNYSITNQHLSIVQNGIAKEINTDKNIDNRIKIYDDEDGKVAYHFDKSKGLDEWESPHSEKAPDYTAKAKQFLDRLKNDEVEQLFQDNLDLKTIIKQNHAILRGMLNPKIITEEEHNFEDKPEYIG